MHPRVPPPDTKSMARPTRSSFRRAAAPLAALALLVPAAPAAAKHGKHAHGHSVAAAHAKHTHHAKANRGRRVGVKAKAAGRKNH
jgi:hypothetical protein